MTDVTVKSGDKEKEFEVRNPFKKTDDGVELQTPVHEVNKDTEFKLQSPIEVKKDPDGHHHTELKSPVEKVDPDEESKVKIRRRP